MPSSRPVLHAYLSYRDAPAALDWLAAVGFDVIARQDAPDGAVLHAEVRLGEATVMVASADVEYVTAPLVGRSTGDGLYLWFPDPADVDDWHTRAVAAGAREVFAPEVTQWGTRRSRLLDPEGKEWSAGTYRPAASS